MNDPFNDFLFYLKMKYLVFDLCLLTPFTDNQISNQTYRSFNFVNDQSNIRKKVYKFILFMFMFIIQSNIRTKV